MPADSKERSPAPRRSVARKPSETNASAPAAAQEKRKHSVNGMVDADYELGDKLGTGAFGVVVAAKSKLDGSGVAIKIIHKDRSSKELSPAEFAAQLDIVRNEIRVLEDIAKGGLSDAIIGFRGAYESKDKLYIVMDRADAELAQIIEKNQCLVSERDAQTVVRRVLEGVAYLHEHDYVHRDIKFENLLMMRAQDFGSVVLTDFGLASKTNEAASGECGTPLYMSPEIWTRNSMAHGPKVDIWAVGIITHILLCGHHPVKARSVEELKAKVCVDRLELSFPEGVPELAQDFVRRLLTIDPISRPAAKDALAHPWLTGQTDSSLHESVVEMMRAYVAELRLKSGFFTVQATTRVRKLSELARKQMEAEQAEAGAGSGAGAGAGASASSTGRTVAAASSSDS